MLTARGWNDATSLYSVVCIGCGVHEMLLLSLLTVYDGDVTLLPTVTGMTLVVIATAPTDDIMAVANATVRYQVNSDVIVSSLN